MRRLMNAECKQNHRNTQKQLRQIRKKILKNSKNRKHIYDHSFHESESYFFFRWSCDRPQAVKSQNTVWKFIFRLYTCAILRIWCHTSSRPSPFKEEKPAEEKAETAPEEKAEPEHITNICDLKAELEAKREEGFSEPADTDEADDGEAPHGELFW